MHSYGILISVAQEENSQNIFMMRGSLGHHCAFTLQVGNWLAYYIVQYIYMCGSILIF